MQKYKRSNTAIKLITMGYDPSTYERAPEKEENTSNNTQNTDEPSSISPKIVFAVVGLLIGLALGYGAAQLFTDNSEPVPVEIPIDKSNNDELSKLQTNLDQANSEILILEGRLNSFDETKDLLAKTQNNLDAINRELLESTNKFNTYEKTIEDLQNDLADIQADLTNANERINELLTVESPPVDPAMPMDPEPPAPAADPAPDPEPAAAIDEKISLGAMNLVYGLSLIPISDPTPVGEAILIETEAINISENRVTISWIAIITNIETGEIKEVYVFNIQLDAGKSFKAGNLWTPASAGQYNIEAFAVDNLTDKNPISLTQSKVITVA
tara:strand:- start:118 stop:1101 length:984 start_codon:yes stop_codon:yes gene_type:complete